MITLPNNQVIKSVSDFDCTCRDKYKTPLELTDNTPVYVQLSELGSNYIANGNFASSTGWTLGANWAISGGKATYTSGASNAITRDTEITLVEGYYLIKIGFTPLTSGGLFMNVTLGGQAISILGSAVGSGWSAQTFYLFGYITPASNTLSINGQTHSFEIDNVEVYRLSEVGFDIKDCDTDIVVHSETNGSSVSYYETGNIVNGANMPTVTVGYATVTFDWDGYGLDEGCYYVCFKDTALSDAEFLRNGAFADDDFWTIENVDVTGWAISGGVATHTPGGTAGNDLLEQDVNLSEDLVYTLEFDVAPVSGSGDKTFSAYYDNDTETDVLLGSQTVSSFPSTVSISITNKSVTTIKIACSASGLRVASIDNATISYSQGEACGETHCISLTSDWDAYAEDRKMCNIQVTGTNANSAFGFPAGYSFKGRIFGKIRAARYPDIENEEYKDFSGAASLQYNDNEAIKELQIFEMPERMHDWLRLALRSQTLTLEINGVSKSFVKVGGDYTPNWRKTSTYAPVIVEIKEAQQLPPNGRNI